MKRPSPKRARVWLKRFWRFIKDLSGEAALERRVQLQAHHPPRLALQIALAEIAEDRPRCC
jgi:hypothetical protein